jgi:hypothetical protein
LVETKSIEVLGSKVRERLGAVDPGVIHQDIDGSEALDRCFDSFGSGLLLTDIAIDENQARLRQSTIDWHEETSRPRYNLLQEALHQTRTNAPLMLR